MPRKRMTEEAVSSEIAELTALDRKGLLSRWLALFGSDPPRGMRRELLLRAMAHRLQVKAWGGLSRALQRALTVTASTARPVRPEPVHLKPGTRLVRVWHGQMYEVEVLADGFVWNGDRYRSLSAIARTITGSRWNGRAFFGLTTRVKAKRDA